MNDKRKNARTQGRFSSSDKDKDKQNEQKKSPPTNKNSDKPQNESFNSQSATKKIDVKYTSESNYSFEEFTKRKPEELKFDGRKEISKTENGVSEMIYNKNFLTEDEADHLRTVLSSSTEWNEKNIVIQGVEYPQPRLVAWYGPLPYSYSGTTLEAKEMPPSILQLKHRVEDYLKMFNINVELNSVLLNLYRDEKDSVAWHSDDELSMGVCPTIASVSLGAIRKFEIRPKKHVKDLADDTMYYINLSHGSLLIMDGSMQKDWMHRVPKEYHDKSARINLTFRTVYCNDKSSPERLPCRINTQSLKSSPSKVVQQPEHKFDSDSFPSLGEVVNYKKSKKDSTCDVQSATLCYKEKEILHEVPVDPMDESQNNLNKEKNCDSYDNQENLNIPEFQKSSSTKFSISNELMDIECNTNLSQTYQQKENCVSETSCQTNGAHHSEIGIVSATESNSNDYVTTDNESIQIENNFPLNVNAPDFVPNVNSNRILVPVRKNFLDYSLVELAKGRASFIEEDIEGFAEAVFKKLHNLLDNPEEFESYFFKHHKLELDTYIELHDGSLTAKNLKVILNRIGSIITYTNSKINDPFRYRNQRPAYRGNPHPKSVFRSSGHRY